MENEAAPQNSDFHESIPARAGFEVFINTYNQVAIRQEIPEVPGGVGSPELEGLVCLPLELVPAVIDKLQRALEIATSIAARRSRG